MFVDLFQSASVPISYYVEKELHEVAPQKY
jgi:hypothetical protein